MKFSCDKCDAQYMISDEKVGPKGVRVRCKKCGNVIPVRRVAQNGAQAAEQPAPVAAATPAPVPGGLDAELGEAFDHAFGGAPSSTPIPGAEAAQLDSMLSQDANAEPLPVEIDPRPRATPAPARTPASAAPPAATEWYVAIGQAQVGPLPLEDVRRKWEGADVGPDSLVWRPGMGDWAPLSSVADLAAYLAPFPVSPRQSRTPAPAASAQRGDRSSTPAPTPAPGDVAWKPVGASALAALASEEISARNTPEPRPASARIAAGSASAAGAASVRTLVEQMDLPDGGGVDPTGAIPLPMKALEATGEHRMERVSSVARGAEELRQRRSASRGLAIGAAAVLLIGGGAAAYWYTGRSAPSPAPARPAPVAAAVPSPAAPAPAPEAHPQAEAAKSETAVAAPEAVAATAPAASAKAEPAVAATEEAKVAATPVSPAPEAVKAAPPSEPVKTAPPAAPPKVARTPAETRAARREAARAAQQAAAGAAAPAAAAPAPAVAAAEPAPAPRRRDVLDFESSDAALEAALGSSKPSGSRSVYVPPAPSGTALQERVTDSQVNETILGRVSALQQCVQQQKARDAETTGVLKMRWTIAPDGSARGAKCVTPEFASGQLAQCLSGALNATHFPKSKLGRQDVTFPIKF